MPAMKQAIPSQNVASKRPDEHANSEFRHSPAARYGIQGDLEGKLGGRIERKAAVADVTFVFLPLRAPYPYFPTLLATASASGNRRGANIERCSGIALRGDDVVGMNSFLFNDRRISDQSAIASSARAMASNGAILSRKTKYLRLAFA